VYAYIGTDTDVEPVITDAEGIASLMAPEVTEDKTLTIKVIKSGYAPKSTTIRVEPAEGFTITINNTILDQLLPLLFAVLAVIFAIFIVRWRQKKASRPPQPVIKDQQLTKPRVQIQERQGRRSEPEHSLFTVNEPKKVSVSTSTSKVEEIRIPVQEKKKGHNYCFSGKRTRTTTAEE
jgi:flagellar biosynthesis/type III secretory pathway M-ring protein FliF/YscJ